MRLLHFGGVEATARWQGHAEQLEKPSSSRREIAGAGRSYNRLNREVDRRREGDGWVRSSVEAGERPYERRSPAVCNVSDHKEGKDEMTKASIDLQDLRRRIYVKAKAETSWKFWGLYVYDCKLETLREAYALAQKERRGSGKRQGDPRGHRSARRR